MEYEINTKFYMIEVKGETSEIENILNKFIDRTHELNKDNYRRALSRITHFSILP